MQTPLLWEAWRDELRPHLDRRFVDFLLQGIQEGFRIGFDYHCRVQPARSNMFSAAQHSEVIDEYLEKEVRAGNIIPLAGALAGLQINRFGVIPKGRTGKWRLITDLSFPEGRGVNDGIDPQYCSLEYVSVDEVALAAAGLGKGSLLAKIDIRAAYRLVPVFPRDRLLLGMRWRGQLYVDAMLPFGLRSAPKLFNALADALEWCLRRNGVHRVWHYLDDFVVVGRPESVECHHFLETMKEVCSRLGVPLAVEKVEGPSSCLTFLGIEIDTVEGTLRLPKEKLDHLMELVVDWHGRKACTRKELESLIGLLQHACKVVRPGRSFLRRMIQLLSGQAARKPQRHVRLNGEFKADVAWWVAFTRGWNGVAIMPAAVQRTPAAELTFCSDASGSWGCGAWSGQQWFQIPWDDVLAGWHIAAKELLPIVIAAALWGKEWHGKQVHGGCDNQAVVEALEARACRDRVLMDLLRCLFFFEATHDFQLVVSHVRGVDNGIADDLSRNHMSSFFQRVPQANPIPSPVPPKLLELLGYQAVKWTPPNWMQQFSSIAGKE